MAKKPSKPKTKKAKKQAVSGFERGLVSLEKKLVSRLTDLEMQFLRFSGGIHLKDSPSSTKVVFNGLSSFKRGEISILVTDHTITVSAGNKSESYYRALSLPFIVVPEKAKPELKDGRLSITIPKHKEKVSSGRRLKF